jgi:hypothetical protein
MQIIAIVVASQFVVCAVIAASAAFFVPLFGG